MRNKWKNIKKIEKDLQRHQQVLTKDVYVFDQMYDMNLEFYKELTMYIIAGKKALEIARSTKLVELREKAEATQDQLDVQMYRDYDDACKRFEKRIYDLETTRLVSIQMAPQIRLPQVALCGASGVVFAFILLSSFTSFKEGEIPITFLLVAVFFIGQQIYEGITVQDNISNMAHIVSGIIGGFLGYGLNMKSRFSRFNR